MTFFVHNRFQFFFVNKISKKSFGLVLITYFISCYSLIFGAHFQLINFFNSNRIANHWMVYGNGYYKSTEKKPDLRILLIDRI